MWAIHGTTSTFAASIRRRITNKPMYSTHQLLIKFKVTSYLHLSFLLFPRDLFSTLGGCASVSPTRLLHSGAGLGQFKSPKSVQRRHSQRNWPLRAQLY